MIRAHGRRGIERTSWRTVQRTVGQPINVNKQHSTTATKWLTTARLPAMRSHNGQQEMNHSNEMVGYQLLVSRSILSERARFEQYRLNSTSGRRAHPKELNKKILELGRNQKWQEILYLYQDNRERFNEVNFTTALNQLSRIRETRTDDPQLRRLVEDIDGICEERGLQWLGIRGTSNVIHAIAKMNLQRNPSALRLVHRLEAGQNAPLFVEHGNSRDTSNVVWACARLGVKSPKLFSELENIAPRFFENGNSRDIANAVWACAKLGVESPNLFVELEKKAMRFVENGDSQDTSSTAWACATLGVKSPELFGELERNATRFVQNGTPQAIANAVGACATLGVQSPKLFSELERNARWFVQNGTPQGIANAIWACATLDVDSPNLLAELERAAIPFVDAGDPQAIANAVWACAKLGFEPPNLFGALERNAARFVQNGTSQSVANAIWACATLAVKSPKLLSELELDAARFVRNGTPQDIASAVWACAMVGNENPGLFSALVHDFERFMERADAQAIINTCYGIVVLHMHHLDDSYTRMLERLWNEMLQMDPCDLTEAELRQTIIIHATTHSFGVSLAPPPTKLQQKFDTVKHDMTSSKFEEVISSRLQEMGFSHDVEVTPLEAFPGLFSIDIACRDRKIAIEYDGPSHYAHVAGQQGFFVENGATKMKRRLLEHLGWTVINLDWRESLKNEASEAWLRRQSPLLANVELGQPSRSSNGKQRRWTWLNQ